MVVAKLCGGDGGGGDGNGGGDGGGGDGMMAAAAAAAAAGGLPKMLGITVHNFKFFRYIISAVDFYVHFTVLSRHQNKPHIQRNAKKNYSPSCTIEIPTEERDRLIQLAHVHFGFNDLYDHQLNAAYAMLNGIDSSVIVGTGSGKSLCYALAALGAKHLQSKKKMVIVISPLIALMKDQVSILFVILNNELYLMAIIHIF